jgi:hypothetical protein
MGLGERRAPADQMLGVTVRRALPEVRDLDLLALGGIFDLSRFTPDNASISMTHGAHTVE